MKQTTTVKLGPECPDTPPGTIFSEDDSDPPEPSIQILITNRQSLLAIDTDRLRIVVQQILEDAQFPSALLSIAIVDDPAIHQLNRLYLQHDWPTDVLSFPLEQRLGHLEGEVVVSAETAEKVAAEIPWPGPEELLLYVIHGTLHLVGYQDKRPEEAAKMRAAERTYLRRMGVEVSGKDDRWQALQPCHGARSKQITRSHHAPRGGRQES